MTTRPSEEALLAKIDDERPCGALARRMAAKMGERYEQLLAAVSQRAD